MAREIPAPSVNGVGVPTILRLLLGLLLSGLAAGADEPVPWPPRDAIRTWRVGSGLPHQRVHAICQTTDGFLWVGTLQGLARFDGITFTPADPPGPVAIARLAAGRDNRLWVGLEDGTLLCGHEGRFETAISGEKSAFPGGFEILAEDRDGRLWITTRSPRVFLYAGGSLRDMTAGWDKSGAHISQVRVDDTGRPIANANDGIWTIEGETLERVEGFRPGAIYHAPGRGHSFWVSDGAGVRRLSRGLLSKAVGPARWENRRLTFGIEDRRGNLWLATEGHGILCYETDGSYRQLDTRSSLCGDFANCLFEDRQGDIWVGSDGGGLSRITPSLFAIAGQAEGLSSDRVTAVVPGAAGALWIGTYGDGLNRFDGHRFGPVEGLSATAGILTLAGRDGELWIGSNEGLWLLKNGTLSRAGGWPLKDRAVRALHFDRSGALWVGQRTPCTVLRLHEGAGATISLRGPQAPGPEVDVSVFAEDGEGREWIGTDGAGLFAWKDGAVEAVGSFVRVSALGIAADGGLWVAADAGLSHIRPGDSGRWTLRREGMHGTIHTLKDDGRGGVWFTDDRGLAYLRIGGESAASGSEVMRFGAADGLPDLQGAGVGFPQSASTGEGCLWLATTAGLARVNPADFAPAFVPPPLLLEQLRVNGTSRWTPASKDQVPVFESGDRGFEFCFNAIDLRHPEMLSFASRIDGVDEQWRPLGGDRTVFHASLPPGHHVFRVKALGHGGVWSEERTLTFQILPPLWQRGWFVLLAGGLALGLAAMAAWLISAWRLQKQLAAMKVERALETERSRIARDIHDQLGSGLTEIAYLGDYLRLETAGHLSQEAADVSARARELARTMDETVWTLNPENDTFDSLLAYLGHSMTRWLRPGGIRCRLDFPEDSRPVVLPTPVRQQLYLCCKEAVHNAVKHSGASELTLSVERSDTGLTLTVADNGCGFDPAALPAAKGNGLPNMRRRLADLGGVTTLTSRPGHGTTLTFHLPLDFAIPDHPIR